MAVAIIDRKLQSHISVLGLVRIDLVSKLSSPIDSSPIASVVAVVHTEFAATNTA